MANAEKNDYNLKEFFLLFNNMNDAAFVHDLKGNFLEINDTAVNMLGYSKEELLSMSPQHIDAPEFAEKVEENIKQISENKQLVFESAHITKTGEKIPVEISSKIIQYRGQPVILSIVRDITERKRAEISEKRYKLLFEKAGDAIFILDGEKDNIGDIVDANQKAADIHGYTLDEILDMNIKELDTKEAADEFPQRVQRTFNGEWIKDELKHLTKSGNIIQLEKNAGLVELDGHKYILTIERDINKRKQLEERINKINNILVNLGSDYYKNIESLTDICGELLDATSALYNRLEDGRLCSLAQWNTPVDYNSVDYPEGHICYDVIMKGETNTRVIRNLQSTNYAVTDPNVVKYGLKSYIGRVVYCNGEPVGVLCVVYRHDVKPTEDDKHILSIIASSISSEEERKKSEDNVQEYAKKLEKLNETKEMFNDILRHDLLNPVSIVKGYAGLLFKNETDENKISMIENIINNNDRAIELIENAGNLAKIECMDNIEFQKMDIGDVIKNVINDLQFKSNEKSINIKFVNKGNYYANANSIIEQAFSNLLTNSLKYSPEGSEILVELLDEGNYWKINIKDSGPGISDEDKNYLFDRFKQGNNKKNIGKGLGLSIVKNIIELHGGNVGVKDNPESTGSIFWVTIEKADSKLYD